MSTISTRDAIVYLAGASGAAVTLTEAAEVTIDIDFDLEGDTAFGDLWEGKVQGLKRFSGSITGNFDTAQSLLFDAIGASSSRALYVYPDRSTSANYYYGNVWPRLSITMPFGIAKFSVSFDGDGQLAIGE